MMQFGLTHDLAVKTLTHLQNINKGLFTSKQIQINIKMAKKLSK